MRLLVLVLLTGIFSVAQAQVNVPTDMEKITVLSWNIYMLPGFLGYGKVQRAEAIGKLLADSKYDVIVFQEAFHLPARRQLNKHLRSAFPFQAGPANHYAWSLRANSGLWIFSKHPIQFVSSIEFETRQGIDAMARKGGLLVELTIRGKVIQIIGTHLQNSGGEQLKQHQCVELFNKVLRKHQRLGVPQIVCGDFNIDRYTAENTYNRMLQTLNASNEETVEKKYSYDRLENDLNVEKGSSRNLIDFILMRPNNALLHCTAPSIKRFQQRWHPRHQDLSDHYSVETEIVFNNTTRPLIVSTQQPGTQ